MAEDKPWGGLGDGWWMRSSTWASNVATNHPYPGQQVKGCDSAYLLYSNETPPAELHSVLGSPAKEGCGPDGADPEEGTAKQIFLKILTPTLALCLSGSLMLTSCPTPLPHFFSHFFATSLLQWLLPSPLYRGSPDLLSVLKSPLLIFDASSNVSRPIPLEALIPFQA